MRKFDPRKLTTAFARNREAILDRIQDLIRNGFAVSIDGTTFETDLSEAAVRIALGLRPKKKKTVTRKTAKVPT